MNSTNRTIVKQFYALLLSLSLVLAPIAGADAKRVFAQVSPSIVVISVLAPEIGDELIFSGSGVVIGEGLVITNCHVIEEEGVEIVAVFVEQAADSQGADGYEIEADIIARDEDNDLCLLFAGALTDPPAAPVVKLGAAKMLVRGEEVYAVGTPAGLKLSLSRGIVTQLRGIKGKAPIVQTDAAIQGGSSGGGLFNESGELVGITTFGADEVADSINFAMPVEMVLALIQSAENQVEDKKAQFMCIEAPQHQCVLTLAQSVAKEIDDFNERTEMLSNIAREQVIHGYFDEAKAIAHQIPTNKIEGGADEYIDHYSADHASRLLSDVAIEQAEAGYFDDAKATANQIDDAGVRTFVLGEIVVAQVEKRDFDGEIATEQYAGNIEKNTRNFEDAKATAQQIDDAYKRASVLSKIAIAEGKVKDFDDGRMTFHGALRAAQQVGDAFGRASALAKLAMEQAEVKFFNGATITIKEALDESQQIENPFHRAAVLKEIASVQAKVGDFDGVKTTIGEALRWTQQVKNTFFRVSALSEIAILQAQTGDVDGAKATAMEIRGTSYHSSVLIKIAIEQALSGEFDDAKATVQQIRGTYYHASVLSEIAVLQAQAKDLDGAKATAQQINNTRDYTRALFNIVAAQAETGDFKGAMQTAQLINYDAVKARALINIAEALARQ